MNWGIYEDSGSDPWGKGKSKTSEKIPSKETMGRIKIISKTRPYPNKPTER